MRTMVLTKMVTSSIDVVLVVSITDHLPIWEVITVINSYRATHVVVVVLVGGEGSRPGVRASGSIGPSKIINTNLYVLF